MSRSMLSALDCQTWLMAGSVAASPGPPAGYVTASFRAAFETAGTTTTLSPIVSPFGFARFSGTTKVPQRASIPCTTHGSGGHDQRAWFEKNARSMPTTMPAAATRPTRTHTTHLGDQWTRCGTGCALVDTIRLVQCEAGVRCGPWTRGQAPPEPATTSASTAITSETGLRPHPGAPLTA